MYLTKKLGNTSYFESFGIKIMKEYVAKSEIVQDSTHKFIQKRIKNFTDVILTHETEKKRQRS